MPPRRPLSHWRRTHHNWYYGRRRQWRGHRLDSAVRSRRNRCRRSRCGRRPGQREAALGRGRVQGLVRITSSLLLSQVVVGCLLGVRRGSLRNRRGLVDPGWRFLTRSCKVTRQMVGLWRAGTLFDRGYVRAGRGRRCVGMSIRLIIRGLGV